MTVRIHLSGHEDRDRHVHAVDLAGMNLWVAIGKRIRVGTIKVSFQKYKLFFPRKGRQGIGKS